MLGRVEVDGPSHDGEIADERGECGAGRAAAEPG